MATLPIDIITNILSRITVNSLLKLQLVCKEWLTLIRSTYFANLHTNHHSLSSTTLHRTFIVTDKENSKLYSINLDSSNTSARQLLVNTTNLFKNREIKLIGSCNGILCLLDTTQYHNAIILFNPVTHRCKVVHDSEKEYRLSRYGFGYDSYERDYKLVRVSSHPHLKSLSTYYLASVYSLRTNSWKEVGYNKMVDHADGVLIGSHLLHWILPSFNLEHYPSIISCFNLCDDTWSDVLLPAHLVKTHMFNLGVFEGYLSVMAAPDNRKVFDVWIMKEYGVAESWVKVLGGFSANVNRSIYDVVAYSTDGQKILVSKHWNYYQKKMFWYNPRTKTKEVADFVGIPKLTSYIMFREGFGTIPDGVQIGELDN